MTSRIWKKPSKKKPETKSKSKTHFVKIKLDRQDIVFFLVLLQVLLLIVILIRLAQTTSRGIDRQETTTTRIATKDFQVQVLNGTGIQQPLAGKVTDWLRHNGCSMLEAGNADNRYNNSYIYYFTPNRKQDAVRLASLLGVNIQYVVLGSSSDNNERMIQHRLTVVIGQDYEQLTPFLNDR